MEIDEKAMYINNIQDYIMGEKRNTYWGIIYIFDTNGYVCCPPDVVDNSCDAM